MAEDIAEQTAEHSFIQYGAYHNRKKRSHTKFRTLRNIQVHQIVEKVEVFIDNLIREHAEGRVN